MTPWRPVRPWSRRCEKKRSGRRTCRRRSARRARRRPPVAHVPRTSRDRASRRARRRRRRPRGTASLPPHPPRSSTGRCSARWPRRGVRPPSARTRLATIPARSPRQPAWRISTAGRSPSARAIAIGMQSAVSSSIARPGASLQSPSQWSYTVPRRDDAARLRTRHRRAVPLPGHRRAVGIGADRVAQPCAVDDDTRRHRPR